MTCRSGSRGKVIVGLSGGVDSAVAALLLQRRGYDVEGVFMKNWEEDDYDGYCSAAADLADARAVAERLGIPLHTVNFATEYWDRVFQYFLSEYRAGRTPNPDVLCNREIKFRAFLDHALGLGAEHIATGHYARVTCDAAGCRLLRAADVDKDQTYFLHLLDAAQLRPVLFPLGGLKKREVRRIAEDAGLPNARKKDSTGICFIGERPFQDFLQRYLPARPGPILTLDGRELGRHQGLMYHTLGQRKGLGIGGRADAGEAPWYVAGKDLERNILWVVQGRDHPLLHSRRLHLAQVHWIAGAPPARSGGPLELQARIRHRQPLQSCRVVPPWENGECEVLFYQPQWAATPGQSVVFYQGESCLGGGIIDRPPHTVESMRRQTLP